MNFKEAFHPDGIFKNPAERVLSTKILEVTERKKLLAARTISQQAIEFAVRELDATRPNLVIKPLAQNIAGREGIRGFWNLQNTAYVILPNDKTELTIVTAHETAHPIHDQLWIARSDHHQVIGEMKSKKTESEAIRAAKEFFYLPFEDLFPGKPIKKHKHDDGDSVESVGFGNETVSRVIRHPQKNDGWKQPDGFYWPGANIDGSWELVHKPYKLEEMMPFIKTLPPKSREIVVSKTSPVLKFHKLMEKMNDLNRMNEGWCEFFAYVFAQSQGLPIDLTDIRKNDQVFGIGIDEYVGIVGAAIYKQGFYELTKLADKYGAIKVLRESLKANSTQDLHNRLA